MSSCEDERMRRRRGQRSTSSSSGARRANRTSRLQARERGGAKLTPCSPGQVSGKKSGAVFPIVFSPCPHHHNTTKASTARQPRKCSARQRRRRRRRSAVKPPRVAAQGKRAAPSSGCCSARPHLRSGWKRRAGGSPSLPQPLPRLPQPATQTARLASRRNAASTISPFPSRPLSLTDPKSCSPSRRSMSDAPTQRRPSGLVWQPDCRRQSDVVPSAVGRFSPLLPKPY
eukprot:15807-Chlamydomonas_euryale.AAC.3